MRIYLSGPITGTDDFRERFEQAVDRLRKEGHTDIVNPGELSRYFPGASWEEYMQADTFVLGMCDALVLLPGWTESKGCQREYGYALASDKLIWEMEE